MKNNLFDCGQAVRRIGIVVFDGVVLADVLDMADVFTLCDKLISAVFPKVPQYQVSIISSAGGPVTSSSSVQIMTESVAQFEQVCFDSLIVASGTGSFEAYRDPVLISWLQNIYPHVVHTAGICTGIFVLGAAGLLEEHKVAVHWALINKLLSEYPKIKIEKGSQIVEDEGIFTVSDVGIASNLAVQLVERELGATMARRVEQELILYRQSRDDLHNVHFLDPRKNMPVNRIHKASLWLAEHWNESISVIDVANEVAMSERNFTRQFKMETGKTPHDFLLQLRLDEVRRQLSETDFPVDKIARRCGLLSGAQVAKLFRKNNWQSPTEYRKLYRGTVDSVASK
ncbi:transcriptional regulator GlxA family with amidase domain [Oxalobacteraceae bacterium GrIS 2.11]